MLLLSRSITLSHCTSITTRILTLSDKYGWQRRKSVVGASKSKRVPIEREHRTGTRRGRASEEQ